MANAGEGQTSGATDQNIELQQWLKSIVEGDPIIPYPQRAKIPKVLPVLRKVESDKTCYDPQVVSIGPYHHGKAGLEEGEHLKTAVASYFIQKSGKSGDEIFNKVLKVSEKARNYYDNVFAFIDNETFARIMFLDGCFLLQYMYSFRYKSAQSKRLQMLSSHSVTLLAQDLLMVENQLPSVVINALLVFVPGNSLPTSRVLHKFVCKMYGNQVGFFPSIFRDPKEMEDHLHLLDIFRKMYIGPKNGPKLHFGNVDKYEWLEETSFPSAKELQSIGVKFKVKSYAFPADIRFSSYLISAYLTLPEITIGTSTKAIFLNMLAYEMSKEDDCDDNRFTDFICFMDSLIDQADDVKILKKSGVLNQSLGSDEQVADLFNHIGKNLIPSCDAYWRVKQGMQKHYKSKIRLRLGEMSHTYSLWLDEMWNTYFRSPWTLMALIVAVIYLGASLTQTYFTVFPRR